MVNKIILAMLCILAFCCNHTPNITEATTECEISSDSEDWCDMLGPACPNPASEETKILWSNSIADDVHFELVILNSQRQVIRKLVDHYYPRGDFAVVWALRDSLGVRVPSGFYSARLSSGSKVFCDGTTQVIEER